MLEQLVHWLAYGSLAIGALSAYLHLNKLWSRKHIKEVAESISISGTLLEALPTMIFGLYFLTRQDPVGVIDSLIWLVAAGGFIMIGSGYWVKGQRREGILRLAWRSLRSERGEVGNLVLSVFHHSADLHAGCGGRGVTVGEFHTRDFADTVCREYRDLGFFCVVTDELVSVT